MDPNETLEKIRKLYNQIIIADDPMYGANMYGEDLAELIGSLDGWITMGGFLPDDWKKEAETKVSIPAEPYCDGMYFSS